MYSFLTSRKGVSAMQLSKELGVQYRTAWHMLHRIREACGNGAFTLSNVVEADDGYVGDRESNKYAYKKLQMGRVTVGKAAVNGSREREGGYAAKPIRAADSRTLIGVVEGPPEQGSTIYSDDASAYAALPTIINQYTLEAIRHGPSEHPAGSVHTSSIESIWALLKRSVQCARHHVSPKHLERYVNEAAFRLNDRNFEVDAIDRMESLAKQIGGKRLRYGGLIADTGESSEVVSS